MVSGMHKIFRLRFSLRTLFLIVTFVAISLAWFGNSWRRWQRLDAIVAELETHNIFVDGSGFLERHLYRRTQIGTWLCNSLGPSSSTRWNDIDINPIDLMTTDDDYRNFKELRAVNDATYDLLLNFPTIQRVHARIPLSAHGMQVIASLPALEAFSYETFYFIPNVISLLGSAPHLKSVLVTSVNNNAKMSEHVRGISKLRHLERLGLRVEFGDELPDVLTLDAVREITSLTELRMLSLQYVSIPAEAVYLLKDLPKLETLCLTDDSLAPNVNEIFAGRQITIKTIGSEYWTE
jgi:hypothetical protein